MEVRWENNETILENVNLHNLLGNGVFPLVPPKRPNVTTKSTVYIDNAVIVDNSDRWDNLLSYMRTNHPNGYSGTITIIFDSFYTNYIEMWCRSPWPADHYDIVAWFKYNGFWIYHNGIEWGQASDWQGGYNYSNQRLIETVVATASEMATIWGTYRNVLYNRIRFPRFVSTDYSSNIPNEPPAGCWDSSQFRYAGTTGPSVTTILWTEEDQPVDTRWTKPRSMLSMVNAYTMTDAQMETFKKCLWYMDGNNMELSNKLYSNPMDCIIGAYFIPFEIPAGQVTSPDIVWAGLQNLKFYDTMEKEAVFPKITDEFVEYTLGVVNIERVFNDYRDFTEVSLALYLPCIGWKTLDAQTWMGYDMKIKYRVNFLTGEIIALIIMSDDDIIIDTCKGQCAQQVPISGRDFTNLMQAKLQKQGAFMAAASGFVAGALATAGGALTANPLVAGGGIAGMVGSVANGLRSSKAADVAVSKAENHVVRDGDIGGSSAILGYPKAFVLKAYHMDAMPQRYQNYQGYQANQILTISTLTGYIKAREVYFSSARATEQEKTMVENALKEGVFR